MAVTSFLREENKTAKIRTQQCEDFLTHKIEGSGVLEDPEIRQELYNMRKNAAAHKRHVLRVMSLTR